MPKKSMYMPAASTCLFVYGLVDASGWTDGGAALQSSLAALPGIEPACPPALLVVGRLGVLVSSVPVAAYTDPALAASVQELEWLEPRARAHAAVIAAAFAHQPVLPLRFGTLFSEADALAALAPQADVLLAELAQVAGQEEWTVRFCAAPTAVVERYAAKQVEGMPAGQGAQYLRRRHLAIAGTKAVLAQLQGAAEAAAEALVPYARLVTSTQTEVTGLPGQQRSLLSRVYQLERSQREPFLAELAAVTERLAAADLGVLVSGPWPPTREPVAHE